MAGKRIRDDGTGSDVPKKKRKRHAQEEQEQRPRGGASTATPEARVEADVEFEKGKGKKSGKRRGEGRTGSDDLDSRPISDAEPQRKKKKQLQEEDAPLPPRLDGLQSVEDHGLDSSASPQRKKKKKKEVVPEPSTPVTSQIVEDHGLLSGAEPQRKKKKTTKEVTSTPLTLDSPQVVGYGLKKKKKTKEATPTPLALDSPQIVEDGLKKKKKTKEATPTPLALDSPQVVEAGLKKKKKTKEATLTPLALDSPQIVKDGLENGAESLGKKRKKRKSTTMLPSSDPSQAAEDCGPESGSAKRTILKSRKPQAGNGAESDRKKKKKVTFQLPHRVEDESSGKELLGKETELTDLEISNWATDKLRPGLVYGMYTAEEDGLLKQAVFDYIQEKGWDREEGLEKILNSRGSDARGCWHVIRKCLPQRELKRIYTRAHRILGPGTLLGKWSDEEMQSLIELHSVHGKDWKRIATVIGRDPEACHLKWRDLKWSTSKDYKSGPWSEEEQQKLCELVLKSLHVKAQMAKKGLITKDHRIIRDDINWEFIAEQMGGRGRLDCLSHWYRRMASPMVTTGEWSNGDDQRLLGRLMEEFPLSEELVEWDSLLGNRSGETCSKRWEQMQRTLGRGPDVRHLHFLEKLESVMKRFAPYLLDSEYDQKFAEDMQRADTDEPEDLDV